MITSINEIVFDNRYGLGHIVNIERVNGFIRVSVKFKDICTDNIVYYTSSGNEILDDGSFSDKPVLFAPELVDDEHLTGEWNEHPLTVTKNLYPGQPVICRRYSNQEWIVSIFSHYEMTEMPMNVDKNISPYRVCNGEWMKWCLPLKGFEEYVNTIDIPDICYMRYCGAKWKNTKI